MSEANESENLEANDAEPDETESPQAEPVAPQKIHKVGRTASGAQVSAGYYVIGPNDQLVLQRPDQPLKGGWRLATQEDIDEKERLEQERRATDTSGEHAERAKLAAAAAAKRAWVEGRSTKLTL